MEIALFLSNHLQTLRYPQGYVLVVVSKVSIFKVSLGCQHDRKSCTFGDIACNKNRKLHGISCK